MTEAVRENASVLQLHGGSPIGNSRVKLTNVEDCVKRGLVVEGENPLHRAAEQLMMDQNLLVNANRELKHVLSIHQDEVTYLKLREKKIMYLVHLLQGKGYPVT